MAVAMADVELLDRVVTGAPALPPADLKSVRLGVVPGFLANLDSDTRGAWEAALARLKAAGVTVVDVAMPQLAELNGKALKQPMLPLAESEGVLQVGTRHFRRLVL